MPTKGKILIRPATTADYPAIANLLNQAFGQVPLEKRQKLWGWRNENNPARDRRIPSFLIAEKNGQVVGVHGLTPLRIKVADNEFRVGCSCDLAVNPAARSVGVQIKLRAMSKDISSLHISTSANEPANKITLALGGKEISVGHRKYLKPLKLSAFLRRKIGGAPGRILGTLLGIPLDSIMSIARQTRPYPKPADSTIQDFKQFDQRFDRFWDKISKNYPIMIIRDSAYLNWRYANYPFGGVQAFGLVRADEILGFAAIHTSVDEHGLAFAVLLELLTQPGQKKIFEYLLRESIKRASRGGAHYIQAKTSVAEWAAQFKKYGFKAIDLSYSCATFKNNTDLPDELFAKEGNWYLSYGDGDFCYFIN